MKKFVIGVFRNYPICTGLLCLILLSHIIGPKNLQKPILSMPTEYLPIYFFYVISMLFYMLFVLRTIEQSKREKITWGIVALNVIVLAIAVMIFI
ncbi:MAG: hypothetical protein J6W11_05085 [Alphaproteobacteria bacterium]|nr:hypothetical protein [Alphaproteobacteria bacterium]